MLCPNTLASHRPSHASDISNITPVVDSIEFSSGCITESLFVRSSYPNRGLAAVEDAVDPPRVRKTTYPASLMAEWSGIG